MTVPEDQRRSGRSITIASAEVLGPVFGKKIDYATLKDVADKNEDRLTKLRALLAKRVG